ncbi:sensor histidine kinase [Paenibacillus sp. GCM10027627]|uniref:sensor histidine kinase n=1 Tax=unclassified Paenibacillus TaxID=185978 RepID=UPI003643F3C1
MKLLQFSYYRRIQLSFLALVLLPIIAVSLLSFHMTKATIIDKILTSNQGTLNVMGRDISKTVDDLVFASDFMIQDLTLRPRLQYFSQMRGIENYTDYEQYTALKDKFSPISMKALNSQLHMFLVNPKGFIIPSLESPGGMAYLGKHWDQVKVRLDDTLHSRVQWLGMAHDEGSDENTYYYAARAIRDNSTNEFLAAIVIGINKPYFENLFAQTNEGSFVLQDENGDYIAGDASLLKREQHSSVRSEVTISRTNWRLVYDIPEKNVVGQVSKTFYTSAFLIVVFVACFYLLSLLMARGLHRPIRKLEAVAKKFGEGNLKVRFPAKGKDEINELGRTLNDMLDRINQLISDIEQEQEQKRVMEMQAIFSKIRPHFLLNTLNSIKCSLALQQDRKHSMKIDALMSLLRAYMKVHEPSTLKKECQLLLHYIEIMEMRNDKQIQCVIDIPTSLEEASMPKLLLQPLVENAIVHGFADLEEEACIWIEVRLQVRDEVESIRLRLKDNGTGMPKEKLARLNSLLTPEEAAQHASYERVGLVSVYQGLQLAYGSEAAMQLSILPEGGIMADMTIPIKDSRSG